MTKLFFKKKSNKKIKIKKGKKRTNRITLAIPLCVGLSTLALALKQQAMNKELLDWTPSSLLLIFSVTRRMQLQVL